jgi:hypothetical protein
MSSANLRRLPDGPEQHASIRDAAVEVAEQSFFAFADPVDETQFAEMALGVDQWLEVSVAFSGAFSGSIACLVAEPLARELFASFLGESTADQADDERLFDLVGEFGNMVCGSWLTRACQRRRFDLEHPVVVRRQATDVRPGTSDDALLALNGQPLGLRLTFSGE